MTRLINNDNGFSLDFLGLGAEKAGTTWVVDALRQHPEVFIPKKKEVYFFNEFDPHFLKVKNPKYSWGMDWYKKQFVGSDGKIKGEFSPTYLYCKNAKKRIKKDFPNTRFIVVLRDPVKRAFSQYIQDKRFGLVGEMSFEEALEEHDNYVVKGKYFEYLTMYFEDFSKEKFVVLFLDEIKNRPYKTLKKIYRFLGLKDKQFKPKVLNKKSNKAKEARFVGLNKFMISIEYSLRNKGFDWILRPVENSGIRKAALFVRDSNAKDYESYPNLSKEIEEKLYLEFKKDIANLENLLNINLDRWKR